MSTSIPKPPEILDKIVDFVLTHRVKKPKRSAERKRDKKDENSKQTNKPKT
jgi:hypothetical protein